MLSENEKIYDGLMAQGKRAEADAYAEAHMEEQDEKEEFDSPRECVVCETVFDAAEHFTSVPYRVYCPSCGTYQPKEYDQDYYIEY